MLDPFSAYKYNQKTDKVDFPIFENISNICTTGNIIHKLQVMLSAYGMVKRPLALKALFPVYVFCPKK